LAGGTFPRGGSSGFDKAGACVTGLAASDGTRLQEVVASTTASKIGLSSKDGTGDNGKVRDMISTPAYDWQRA
jgi:hypothetical protein